MQSLNHQMEYGALSERSTAILRLLADGLSDREIAERLVMTVNTVKWYNRQIYSKLGVGSRTQAIALAGSLGLLDGAPPTPAVRVSRPPAHLPVPATSFIGRRRELAEISRLLNTQRLLTLTGAGGIGKTRLALQVAHEIADRFDDGVYFVDLAPLTDPAIVPVAIATALDTVENASESTLATLKRGLASQNLLLLIDNFEHVIAAAPLLVELLAACPALRLLVTSRESLRVSGEQEYPVLPLSLPSPETLSVEQLAGSEAAALFVQRAQMTQPRFQVGDDDAAAVARICAHLDGLPLAIELAAARTKLLTPKALLERLDGTRGLSPLHALEGGWRDAPPRQRTLRASIEWSYDLLSEGEKRLFARLSVFRGSISLDALEAVCGQDLPIDVFDGLVSLVDKSLVQQKAADDDGPRFALLEMIHEFACEQLETGDEVDAIRRRHAEYYVALVERAEPELRLAGYDLWCRRFEQELDNLRAVLRWSLASGDLTLGVRLVSALGLFCYGNGYHVEGHRWMSDLLARLDQVPVEFHPRFLICAGHIYLLYDLETARGQFVRALETARALGDTLQSAWALTFLAYTRQRDPQAAMPLAEESLALFRALDHLPGVAQALNIVGEIARLNGDDARARQAYEETLTVCQQTGEARRVCYLYNNLAFIAQHERDYTHAVEWSRQALRLARDRQSRRDALSALSTLAGSIGMLTQPQGAARLLGATDAAFEKMGAFYIPSDRPEIERIVTGVRVRLGDAAFEAAWKAGRAMSLDQIVAFALDLEEA